MKEQLISFCADMFLSKSYSFFLFLVCDIKAEVI